MPTLKQIVEECDTPLGRGFDLVIQALIILSLISFTLETLPNLPPGWAKFLNVFEAVTVIIFTIEYLLRVFVARPRWKYIFSFYGLVDLMAILPFYIALGVDMRGLRALRMLRLFRIFKLARYNEAMRRYDEALRLVREELVLFLSATMIVLFIVSTVIYYFEKDAQPDKFGSVAHSMWWAIVTLTTVGYGDTFPITLGGRVFTFFVLLLGIGVITIPAGLFASALTKVRDLENEEKNEAARANTGGRPNDDT